jgi:L-amino acid N-acyltransferase YncA
MGTKPMTATYTIRLIEEADTAAVCEIYTWYVNHTAISFEYDAPSESQFRERIRTNTAAYPWLVCLQNDTIIGYAYASVHRYRTAYQWSPESTIYLTPEAQGKGIARILYETLFDLLRLQGYVQVFAGIALPNEKSMGLHTNLGFKPIGVFKQVGYKIGQWHDTYWCQLALCEAPSAPKAPIPIQQFEDTSEYHSILAQANAQLYKP